MERVNDILLTILGILIITLGISFGVLPYINQSIKKENIILIEEKSIQDVYYGGVADSSVTEPEFDFMDLTLIMAVQDFRMDEPNRITVLHRAYNIDENYTINYVNYMERVWSDIRAQTSSPTNAKFTVRITPSTYIIEEK